MFISIVIAIVSVVGLLTLHEFGHFIIAKRIGMKVEEFGVGYPPRLFGKKYGETLYSLNLLPFGAFVKIPDVEGREITKPAWQRALVLLGGVVSFWIIAVVLLSIVFSVGAPQAISDTEEGPLLNPKVQILAVAPDSPVEKAGIKAGDAIKELKVQNEKINVNKVIDVQEFTDRHRGETVTLTIQRGKEIFEASLTPRVSPPEGEGAMGIALSRTAEKSYSGFQAIVKGVEATGSLTYAVILGWGNVLTNLVKGAGLPKGVQFMGPIGIGSLITQAAQVGINYFLQFIAMIAVYLAIFNVLPIPALDGGKLLFLGIEKIKGSPINRKVEEGVTAFFFFSLIILMVWVTIKDIGRLF
ncbi:MAG: RIP metalloprotease RseP [Candidatus Nealsonbacteria bacterium CG_4_10_14_0_2_um_filter_40_15]|uniref:Zinc metalloprotease n=1 Tax=Candidatus Nealsonbacteria bacterium CG_4_10_14_0_2_um_filter_40_15 TaxID=1974682 RepID=A0A2M7UU63_9BACT|nr:MAG: RIP metalloprotease RseP [Candidatus Nealsonbacteria bacterium CG_4_10_14_0_2_um_filter_40_15]